MIKSKLAHVLAKPLANKDVLDRKKAIRAQKKVLKSLVKTALETQFGKDHSFASITNETEFKKQVPIRDYEDLKPYIDRVRAGKPDQLWPEIPKYWAKTSGTTSGAKYIPLTKASMPFHIKAARNALLNFANKSGDATFFDGKMIFLQGSPVLDTSTQIPTGRLSGIVAHHVPKYLQKNRLPSWETNSIDDWEQKLEAIYQETRDQDMRLISGIPPWIIMYFELLKGQEGKPVGEIFPNLSLIVTGGVNYEPYRQKMSELLGREVPIIQTFPASEGFFAYQDQLDDESLLLLIKNGMYYEFVPLEQMGKENPTRLGLEEVELHKDYALVLSTNAGLWAYNIGDVVRFVNLDPFRIVVSGRVKHYTSSFGEHVIAKEVENALRYAVEKNGGLVTEFTVAPQVNPTQGLPHHEWFIEFEEKPSDMQGFRRDLDAEMQRQNVYYLDLIAGKVLRPLEVQFVEKNGFKNYMESIGKLGGQNKLPRLANDRKIAEALVPYLKS